MKFRDKELESPELNLTPLIDIVFLLLIFFMVSSSFDRHQSIQVSLPEMGTATEPLKANKTLMVGITAEGHYRVDHQLLALSTTASLKQAMQKKKQQTPDLTVVISADKSVNYQQVIDVMDVARQLDLTNISLTSRMKH